MTNKNNKDTYDKMLPENGVGGLFSENSFDEMQKAVNRETGFKMFRAFFWVIYLFSALMLTAAAALESTPFTFISAGLMFLCTAFNLAYAARVSAKGALNAKFAETMSKKYNLVYPLLMLAMWLLVLFIKKDTEIGVIVIWLNFSLMYLGNHLCARKNMKVLEKMLKDENEEE
ncbi:MAG: hypothetical protein NC395_05585 [Prevotella sp.]|nr:hypothetical protein [Prevotella sp.]